jgi:hypothetical protein
MAARRNLGIGRCAAGVLAASLAALCLLACGPKNGALSGSDDGGETDDGSGSSSGGGSSSSSSGSRGSSGSSGSGSGGSSGSSGSSGSTGSSGSGGGAGSDGGTMENQRVNSGIAFTDAGIPYCNMTTPCDLTMDTCCVDALGSGTCHSGHSVNCGVGAAFQCVEQTDCPAGQLCCGYQTDSMHGGSKCEAVSACPSQTSAQLCQTNAECTGGLECIPQSCNVGAALPAMLTLCGLQSNATYTCTAR